MKSKRTFWILLASGGILAVLLLIATGVGVVLVLRGHRAPKLAAESATERAAAAQRAFVATNEPVTGPEVPAMQAAIQRFGDAVEKSDPAALAREFDGERMTDILEDAGRLRDLSAASKRDFAKGFTKGMANQAVKMKELSWTRMQVRAVQRLGPDDVCVTTKFWHNNSITSHVRWWLVRRSTDWRTYDYEDMDTGIRISSSTGLAIEAIKTGDPWLTAAPKLNTIRQAMGRADWKQSERLLAEIESVRFPPLYDAVRCLLRGTVAARQNKFKEGLEFYDMAATLNPDMPALDSLRANCLYELKHFQEALDAADRFTAALGPDARTLFIRGNALFSLHRQIDAADAYRASLRDDPNFSASLIGLAHCLSTDQKKELGDWLRKSTSPRATFHDVAADFTRHSDTDSLEQVVTTYTSIDSTDDVLATYYAAEVLVQRKKSSQALPLLLAAAARAPQNDHRSIYHQLALAAVPNGAAVDAYKACTDHVLAFQLLATELSRAKNFATLDQLVNLHAQTAPHDLQRFRVIGQMRTAQDNPTDAIAAYTAGLAAALTEQDQTNFRWLLVNARYNAGDVLDTFKQVSSHDTVFKQLAYRLSADNRPDDLQNLLDLYNHGDPNAALVSYFSAEICWLRADYAACVARLRSDESTILADPAFKWRFADRIVRSLIRTNHPETALTEAQRLTDHSYPGMPLVLALAATGNQAETINQIHAILDTDDEFAIDDLYTDPDFGPILQRPAMSEVQKAFPKPTPKK